MVKAIQEARTVIMRMNDLIAWYLQDKNVQLYFSHNERGTGKICPHFNANFVMDDRPITERCLAFNILCALRDRNYNYTMAQMLSGLYAHAWQHFIDGTDYPDWMKAEHQPPALARPPGRPRKHPPKLKIPEPEVYNAEVVEP